MDNRPPQSDADGHRLAAEYLALWRKDAEGRLTIRFWKGDFWLWEGQAYRRLDDDLEAELNGFIRFDFDRRRAIDEDGYALAVTPSDVKSTMAALGSWTHIPGHHEQPVGIGAMKNRSGLIAMRNGLLDLDALVSKGQTVLLPHTPDWFTSAALPYDFDPKAKCPKFKKFIRWMCEDEADRIKVLQEWFGYSLTPDTSQQKFLLLPGSGRNGKSVLLRVLRAILGAHNCASIGPEKFRERFGLYPLIGKLANICADVDVTKIDEGILKALTGEDPITADRKYKDPIDFTCTAKLVFATNNPPVFEDKTNGVWRRLLVMPCNATITDAEEDRNLTQKLEQELPGIFNWAVAGLKRLKAQGTFTKCEAALQAVEDLRNESDPARWFVRERCERHADGVLSIDQLEMEARGWAAFHGLPTPSRENIGKAVKGLFGVERKKAASKAGEKRSGVYRGIRLKEEADAKAA